MVILRQISLTILHAIIKLALEVINKHSALNLKFEIQTLIKLKH